MRKNVAPTRFLPLTPEQWGKICSIQWSPKTRRTIGCLYCHNGSVGAITALSDQPESGAAEYWRFQEINKVLSSGDLPYRLRIVPNPLNPPIRGHGLWHHGRLCQLQTIVVPAVA